MSFYQDKKQWIMSLFKNRAQHRKMQNSIQELRGELTHIKENFNFLKRENNELKNSLRKLTPQANLFIVETHLAEHCNLNCFCCTHFFQLADEEYTDLVAYEKDIKQLALVTGGGLAVFT